MPKHLRRDILFVCLDIALQAILASEALISLPEFACWPRILEHVCKYKRGCTHCQTRKIPKQKPAGLIEAIPVGQAFEMVGIDVFGPLPKSWEGNQCHRVH